MRNFIYRLKTSKQLQFPIIVLLIIIAFFIFSNCATQKQRRKICETCAIKIERKDSIVIKEIEVPVSLPPVPGPTVYLQSPCDKFCDSAGHLKPFFMEKKENGIKTTIKSNVDKNELEIHSDLEDSVKTKVPVKTKEIYSKEKIEVPAKCELRHITDLEIFFLMVGKAVSLFGAIWLLFLFFRPGGWLAFILKRFK